MLYFLQKKNADLQLQQKGCGRGRGYDHHIRSSYMIITCFPSRHQITRSVHTQKAKNILKPRHARYEFWLRIFGRLRRQPINLLQPGWTTYKFLAIDIYDHN